MKEYNRKKIIVVVLKEMVLSFLVFLTILISASCSNNSHPNLRKVELPELLERLKNNDIDLFKLEYRDSLGNEMTSELREKFNSGLLIRDFYADRNNVISQARLKSYSHEFVFEEIQILELLTNPFNGFVYMDIECENKDSLIRDAYEKDQDVRHGGPGNVIQIDYQNQLVILSILNKCEWPNDPELVESIWFVIQHADSGFMAYYYPQFKQLVKEGKLKASTMALMEDRMLMNNGYPQIYGSQVVQKNVYKMRDPININQLRSSVGLGTIEENTLKFGFEYIAADYIE